LEDKGQYLFLDSVEDTCIYDDHDNYDVVVDDDNDDEDNDDGNDDDDDDNDDDDL